jgi:hypothetical protein
LGVISKSKHSLSSLSSIVIPSFLLYKEELVINSKFNVVDITVIPVNETGIERSFISTNMIPNV